MSHLSLFEGYGIELEYMIVDQKSLKVRPISDQLLTSAAGELTSDYEDGAITWSNELVLHVIEFKTTSPAKELNGLDQLFLDAVKKANSRLKELSACLLPTGMHPLMDPLTEKKIWPHDNSEIYEAYDRIFDCRGHGWSNLQSMHINLPFADSHEFRRLHTAIRFLLPILPALSASSPVVEGVLTKAKDSRLLFYQENQKRVPSIAGEVIPEPIVSIEDYHQTILQRVFRDIAPHDPAEMLREDWLNSRGAIARFGRQSIEIRILDTQECPVADLAIASFVVETLKRLIDGQPLTIEDQLAFKTSELKSIFDLAAKEAESGLIDNRQYLKAWGLEKDRTSIGELLKHIHLNLGIGSAMPPHLRSALDAILASGSLSTRLTHALGPAPTSEKIVETYSKLGQCLERGELFGL